MNKYLLGIDNGSTVSKAALFTLSGDELSVASRKTNLITLQTGFAERDMNEVWQATAEAIKEVLDKSKINPKEIAGIGCTGHGNGLYLVDENGSPVRNAIMSMDSRARDYSDRWIKEGIDKVVRAKTMQSVWAAQPNTLLAWLQDNEPETIKNARWILMCKDYIRFRLTGQIHAELTDMSGTSLLNLQTRDYDNELLESFGIADLRKLLPPIIISEELCGKVTKQAADETGLAEGTPIAGGMFDIDACGLASGMVNDSQLCMVAGTWGNNQYISKNPVIDEDVFMTSCYSKPEYYLMLEGSATSASNLEWFITQFFEGENIKAKQEGKSVYDYLNTLVANTKPEEANIIFLPFLYGSNSHPDAKSCFIGIHGWHNKGHILRAIYEGIVFSHRSHVDKLLKFRDMPKSIQLTGGAANSKEWVQIFADVFQTPVEIPAGSELGALGAAIAASIAVGIYNDYDEAVGSMVKLSRVQNPDPNKADLYSSKYERYKKVIDTLDGIWTEIS